MIFSESIIKSIFLKHLNITIDKIEKQSHAYTNIVYKIKSGNDYYIFKKYDNVNIYEDLVLEKIDIPEILVKEKEYRIEKFIEHKKSDFKQDLLKIAIALKKFHDIKIADFINFEFLLDNEMSKIKNTQISEILGRYKTTILNIIEENKGEQVLCHNDLQPNNILKTDKIIFIDFEYSAIGNCLVDIANLFCESEVDYEKNVYIKNSGYTKSEKIQFLQKYFEKEDVLTEYNKTVNLEVVSHFLWFVWSIHFLDKNNNSTFDYKKYSMSRLLPIKNLFNTEDYGILYSYVN